MSRKVVDEITLVKRGFLEENEGDIIFHINNLTRYTFQIDEKSFYEDSSFVRVVKMPIFPDSVSKIITRGANDLHFRSTIYIRGMGNDVNSDMQVHYKLHSTSCIHTFETVLHVASFEAVSKIPVVLTYTVRKDDLHKIYLNVWELDNYLRT